MLTDPKPVTLNHDAQCEQVECGRPMSKGEQAYTAVIKMGSAHDWPVTVCGECKGVVGL